MAFHQIKNNWKVSKVFRQIFPSSNEGIVVFNPKKCAIWVVLKSEIAEASYFKRPQKITTWGFWQHVENLLDLGTPFQPNLGNVNWDHHPAEGCKKASRVFDHLIPIHLNQL